MKTCEINYCGNAIVVENRNFSERLYVNDELQDEQVGLAFRSRLCGQLQTGEAIKVSIGGVFRMHCMIFINNKMILPEK